jgi:hypothetical protein
MIDWANVFSNLSPTKVTEGLLFYCIIRLIMSIIKFTVRLLRGWALSSEHRVIVLMHLRHKHGQMLNNCVIADCNRLNRQWNG